MFELLGWQSQSKRASAYDRAEARKAAALEKQKQDISDQKGRIIHGKCEAASYDQVMGICGQIPESFRGNSYSPGDYDKWSSG
jgi:hypothetical protein